MLLIILTGSLIGTSVMTLFSYLMAYFKNSNFKEPELLNILLHNSEFPLSPSKKSLVGWSCHYAIGLIFGFIFYVIFEYTSIDFSILNCIYCGLVAGIIGILGWKLMFWMSGNPPKIHLKKFYIQLIIAHLFFGLFIGITYSFYELIF